MHVVTVNYEWPGVTENCGGGGRVGAELVDGLRDRGHTVTVVTDDADGHYATFPLRTFRRLRRVVHEERPDILHGQFSLPSSLLLPQLAREFDVPLVISVMGADVYDPTRYGLVRPLADAANRYILGAADAVVAPSADMRRRVERKYGEPCDVIHYGIDATEWTWRRRDAGNPLHVLTVCRLVERKNLPTAFRAVRRARDRGLDIVWRVVGTGPARHELEEMTHDAGWVRLAGYVDDLQMAMDWGDVFFLPSKHEAFGIVFLEALACGLPVVTSPGGGQTDIIDPDVGFAGRTAATDGGQLPGPSAMYATALETLANEYETHQLATKGYVSDNFSRQQMATDYEFLFRRHT